MLIAWLLGVGRRRASRAPEADARPHPLSTCRTGHPPVEAPPRKPVAERELEEEEIDKSDSADGLAPRTGDHEGATVGQGVLRGHGAADPLFIRGRRIQCPLA